MTTTGENGGAINIDRTIRREILDRFKTRALSAEQATPIVDRVVPSGDKLAVYGSRFGPSTVIMLDNLYTESEFVDDSQILVSVPKSVRPGAAIAACNSPMLTVLEDVGQPPPVTLVDVQPYGGPPPLKSGTPFALVVKFNTSGDAKARILDLSVTMPDGQKFDRRFTVSDGESSCGTKVLDGFAVGKGGYVEVNLAIYDDRGQADYLERRFSVVPSNPLQLYVYPVHSSPRGVGAAEYRSSNNRYYCEGRWVISNGNPYSVTIGPRVRCRVSDAGLGELADFEFDISQSTVPANSTRTIYVYTYHGSSSDAYDLFRDFGDAKYEFWLQTSVGDISDWNVWVAAAQVGITANFVGNFSWAERTKIADIIDSYSTAIYSGVDCIFSPNTPILEIPSSHSDWSRYRDIRVEETKSGKCSDSDEADDLRDDWSAPSTYNDRIDIFFVESFSGDLCASSLGGFSPTDGPSSKGGDKSGVVIDVKDMNILSSSWGEQVMGIIIAHEVGHYLDLDHTSASNNFMNASVGTSNTNITYGQWKDMRDHHFVRRLNP